MLLLHQVGSVKLGEVVRYTVTYTPSHDRILPSPEVLHLRIRNTSAVALRAAFVHGPYTLNVAAYPALYDPNIKFANPRKYGVPEFEPMLKAGGSWTCQLVVPEDIRQSAGLGASRGHFGGSQEEGEGEASVSWVVEVASQVIFSSSAAVGYEVLVARDEKSFNLGSAPVYGNQTQVPQPGKVSDFQQSVGAKDGHHSAQMRGVYSKAITLKVEDTASLWNTPRLPGWDEWEHGRPKWMAQDAAVEAAGPPKSAGKDETDKAEKAEQGKKRSKPRKVHLVVLTHGLHSNLGADMLYLKESIDATVKQAKIDAKARRAKEKAEADSKRRQSQAQGAEDQQRRDDESRPEIGMEEEDEYDDEEVFVRGFSGNATRTERGIKFLGKRLARFVLSMTYPDQPFLPSVKSTAESIATAFKSDAARDKDDKPVHKHSTIHLPKYNDTSRSFQITSISFIGHSLGGLVQTYAIAYIQKHSPQFFTLIRPISFITLASPLLGLSNENPLYVKFALDFGLVGRTGQDLGLTWRAPTMVRSGWGALVSTLGESAHKKVMGEVQPESKPLLRILPTGPAHAALKKFRNRTVYSNVVNDGIVPLRTSCLLFLDWQGLGRVDKARREAGLVESVLGFGWAELTGANVTSPRRGPWTPEEEDAPSQHEVPSISTVSLEPEIEHDDPTEVPQPADNAVVEDDRQSLNLTSPYENPPPQTAQTQNNDGPLSGFFNFFKGGESHKSSVPKPKEPSAPKEHKIYKRSQTLKMEGGDSASSSKSKVTAGHEMEDGHHSGMAAPPRTTFFESAGDLLNPKLPPIEYLIDPSKRPRAIFHDRVYHPTDIPPPPLKKRPTGSLAMRRKSYVNTVSSSKVSSIGQVERNGSTSSSPYQTPNPGVSHEDSGLSVRDYDDLLHTSPDHDPNEVIDSSNMRVEEKIARAYHKGLSWRKVLVKLEPDAHNNIIVRRMFANAHGWPVVKHLVDAHFSDASSARMPDKYEESVERARPMDEKPDKTGAETNAQAQPQNEIKEAASGDGTAEDRRDHDEHRTPTSMHSPKPQSEKPTPNLSEVGEAEDIVSNLPDHSPSLHSSQSPQAHEKTNALPLSESHGGGSAGSPPRPSYDRLDSVTWSDRDWADSGDESEDTDHLAYGHGKNQAEKGKDVERSGSPVWNWTEKIVGKGAGSRSKSESPAPQSPINEGGDTPRP
ncbi:putative serine esterase-domain-containing protein [Xylariales sp. AK1849]|nr:putative serine esterase-domain-containing protein [Xylariales sp. AK1849]